MTKRIWTIIAFAVAVSLGMMGRYASALEYDLTSNGASVTDPYQPNGGNVYGIIYTQFNPQPTGTGKIDPFVQIGQPGGNLLVEHAYNTTVFKTLDNGSSANWNHELLLSAVPTVTLNGITYREFILDVNEEGNIPDRYLSLDEVQVYLSSTPNQSTTDPATLGKLIYDLDGGKNPTPNRDDYVKLDYKLNDNGGGGSGQGDMIMLIPDALFNCNGQTIKNSKDCYVYLYSMFGLQGTPENGMGQSDGFEEWFLRPAGSTDGTTGNTQSPQVPEPASFALLGAGLFYLNRYRKQRAKS
jgi:hypothetical protein